ncbi:MAG: fibronectin type III domain-containing protein [Synergistaceae bacterium]|jgi:hypothetical protein|nr:fibronectin type III domain-containing protein [Synergistaceae bacterium]
MKIFTRKKISVLVLFLALIAGSFAAAPTPASAATDITDVFTDPNFLYAVRDVLGKLPSGLILDTDVNVLTSLNVAGNNISSLAGIEYFTSLETLYCNGNALTSLNVSGLSALKYLYCGDNALTSLDVSGLSALWVLSCGGNHALSSLNVSGLSALKILECRDNALSSLDVSGLNALETLECDNNALSSLNASGLSSLEVLECRGNELSSLNVSGLSSLKVLYCYDNALSSLNLSGLGALRNLDCGKNALTSLDVSGLSALWVLDCDDNALTSLDVSGLGVLRNLYCNDNALTSLSVSGLSTLEELSCYNNVLTSLNLSGLSALAYLLCENNELTSLDVSGLSTMWYSLDCDNNRLSDGTLNISGCSLPYLSCRYNDMATVFSPSSITGYVLSSNPVNINYYPQNASGFRPVGYITGVPERIAVGSFNLSVAQVLPADATNSAVTWSIGSDSGTGAAISGDTLTTTAPGDLRLDALITDGMASGTKYMYPFYIEVVLSTVPGAPVIGAASAGDASASVAFSAPLNDGGSAITGYTVTSDPGNITAAGASSPIRVTGLTNGTAYTFRVTATNAAGTGMPSSASNSVTPTGGGSDSGGCDAGVGAFGLLLLGAASVYVRRSRGN